MAGSVSLLLHCDGTNGQTTFPDSSLNNISLTNNATAHISVSTTAPEFGTGDMSFDSTAATSVNLTAPITGGSALDMGAGAFTVEFWLKYTATPSVNFIVCGDATGTASKWTINAVGAGANQLQILVEDSASGNIVATTPTTTFVVGTWYAFAFQFTGGSGGSVNAFMNGVQGTNGGPLLNTPLATQGTFVIGGVPGLAFNPVSSAIDELRITKGAALYSGNYTPVGPFLNPGLAVVPNVVGLPLQAAVATLTAAGFVTTIQTSNSSTVPNGIVISHNPIAGGITSVGANVILIVSTGQAPVAGTGGDKWGANGGDINPVDSGPILGMVLAYAQQPSNANVQANQSVLSALSTGTSITQATLASNVPTTPTMG